MQVTNFSPGITNVGDKPYTGSLMLVTNLTLGIINAGDKPYTRYH